MRAKNLAIEQNVVWTQFLQMAALVLAALFLTSLRMPQFITGTLVNALLILTVEYIGLPQAIGIGMITPIGGSLSGILPLPLLIMVPFISLANALLVSIYKTFSRINNVLALILAAFAKFAMLYAVVTIFFVRPLTILIAGHPQTAVISQAIVNMMRWPQLFTALTGGILALTISAFINRTEKK
jgi:hypothetical protein